MRRRVTQRRVLGPMVESRLPTGRQFPAVLRRPSTVVITRGSGSTMVRSGTVLTCEASLFVPDTISPAESAGIGKPNRPLRPDGLSRTVRVSRYLVGLAAACLGPRAIRGCWACSWAFCGWRPGFSLKRRQCQWVSNGYASNWNSTRTPYKTNRGPAPPHGDSASSIRRFARPRILRQLHTSNHRVDKDGRRAKSVSNLVWSIIILRLQNR